MLFRCDHCGVEFHADPSKIPNPNVKFKCIKCKIGQLTFVPKEGDSEQDSEEREAAIRPGTKKDPKRAIPTNPNEARKMLTQIKELPSLPFVATKLMELTALPTTTMKQMEEVILKDSALVSKVLRYSNSGLYGRAGQITSMTDALVLLGFSTIKTIVIASSVKSMHAPNARGYCAEGKTLWAHSVEAAVAARLLAKLRNKALVEEAFIVGLLHDIGKSIIGIKLPDVVRNLVALRKGNELTFDEIEIRILGIGHSELGAILCKKWNIPDILEKAIFHHHSPNLNKKEPFLSHVAMISDAISYYLSTPSVDQPEREAEILELESSKFLELDRDSFRDIAIETQETIDRDRKNLDL
ncbi:MAG: HDOD domain-containing protein [Candidatus Coatesbacteria bacterium]|nr:HDOD domain-containing protein [Candidatus Coatesbacteria bacterium]